MRPVLRCAIALLAASRLSWCPTHVGVFIDYRPAILARLERVITRHENCVKWNNPGCLIFVGQAGARPLANGYARFATAAAGEVALERDLRAKLGRV